MKRAICQIGAIAIGVVVCISVNMVHPDHALSSLVTHRLHMIDSSEVGVDSIPPTPPDVHVFSIKRGRGPDKSQPGQVSFSPNDKWGSIVLVVSDASDDRTQYSGLGYRIRHLKGELPDGCEIIGDAIEPIKTKRGLYLVIHWQDGASDDQEGFEFYLAVSSVDLAGNESVVSDACKVADPGN